MVFGMNYDFLVYIRDGQHNILVNIGFFISITNRF